MQVLNSDALERDISEDPWTAGETSGHQHCRRLLEQSWLRFFSRPGLFLVTLDLLESLGQAGPGSSGDLSSAEAANMLLIFSLKPSAGLITLAMFTYFTICGRNKDN